MPLSAKGTEILKAMEKILRLTRKGRAGPPCVEERGKDHRKIDTAMLDMMCDAVSNLTGRVDALCHRADRKLK